MQTAFPIAPATATANRWLNGRSIYFVAYMSFCAFVIYTCMYGFRKPYTVGLYSGLYFWGISYKVCLVVAQVLGYMVSKFYGIRFIAGMDPQKRAWYIIRCIGIAWLSLLLFAVVPPPYNIICLFVNGLPLGMVFGLVFGFLEGRKTTEIMGAFLATSFIFASGLAKTVGKWLMLQFNISDWWMPFAAGAFFVLPLLLTVWMLQQAPPPTPDDMAERSVRNPMDSRQRKAFLKQFGSALLPVVMAYALFTIVRDFVEDFANELWIETGYSHNAGIFASTSTWVALLVLIVIGLFFLIRNNYRAFKLTHYLVLMGISMAMIATVLFNCHLLSPVGWMLSATSGLYLAYLPFNCLYFERMIATYKIEANFGFIMYIADAFGYLGTVLVLLVKEFVTIKYSWASFFSCLFYTAGALGIVLIVLSLHAHHKLFNTFKHKYGTE